MSTQVVPVTLGGGSTVYVEARADGSYAADADGILNFDGVKKIIEELTSDISSALKAVSPDKATVELDLDLAVKPGFLTAVLVKSEADATIKLTLEWDKASAT